MAIRVRERVEFSAYERAYLPEIIDAAEDIFDVYIEPIDLPIGNFLEGFVDSGIRRGIGPAIRSFADWLE